MEVDKEEELSRPCIECEVPRQLILHNHQLMPTLEIGFERFEENKLDSATIMEELNRTGVKLILLVFG